MNCPTCHNELDYFDIEMELCSHCNNGFDSDEIDDNDSFGNYNPEVEEFDDDL